MYCVVVRVEVVSEYLECVEGLRASVVSFLSSFCSLPETVNYVGSRIYVSHSWLSYPLLWNSDTAWNRTEGYRKGTERD